MESREIIQHDDLLSFFNAIIRFKTENRQNQTLINSILGNAINYLKSLISQPLSSTKKQILIQQIKQLDKLGAFDGVESKLKLEAICLDIADKSITIKQLLKETDIQILIQNLTESLHEQNMQLLKSTSLDHSLDDMSAIIKEIKTLKNLPGDYRTTTNLLELYHTLIKNCTDNNQTESAIYFSNEIIEYLNDQLLNNQEKYDAEVQPFLYQQIAKFHYTISVINFNTGKFANSILHAEKALALYTQFDESQENIQKKKAECVNLLIMNYTEVIALLNKKQEFDSVKQTCEILFKLYMSHSKNPYIEIDKDNAYTLLNIWFDVELSMKDKLIEQKSFLPLINTLQILLLSAHTLGTDPGFEAEIASTWSKTVTLAYKHFLDVKNFEALHQMFKTCEVCLMIINMPTAVNNIKLYKIIANYHHGLHLIANNNPIDAKSRFNAALGIMSTLPQSKELKMLEEKIQQELQKIPNLNTSSLYIQPSSNNSGYSGPSDDKKYQPHN